MSTQCVTGLLSKQKIHPKRADRIWLLLNALRANGQCGKNSSVNGRRFCRRKRPTVSDRKWVEWQVIPTSSLVSKWQEMPGSSIKASKPAAVHGSVCDAVDGSSTGTRVPWMWV